MFKNVYYGSASLQGGNESFHRIDIDSLTLFGLRIPTETQITDTPEQESRTGERDTDSNFRMTRHSVAMQDLRAWLRARPRTPLTIGGPGARGPIENVIAYEMRGESVFMRSRDGDCAYAALVNGIDRLCGRTNSEKARDYLQENLTYVRSLRALTSVVKKLGVRVELQRIPKNQRGIFNKDPFGWISTAKEGIMLVRVEEKTIVDHCIVVDTRARLIIDSCHEFPLRLSVDILRSCGDSSANELEVGEVRLLVKQRDKLCSSVDV